MMSILWAKKTVVAAIEDELKRPIEQLLDVSQEHLPSASVAQTHRAVLLNGDEVVLKIQRPHIQEANYRRPCSSGSF